MGFGSGIAVRRTIAGRGRVHGVRVGAFLLAGSGVATPS
jgi:hypothetical protein